MIITSSPIEVPLIYQHNPTVNSAIYRHIELQEIEVDFDEFDVFHASIGSLSADWHKSEEDEAWQDL